MLGASVCNALQQSCVGLDVKLTDDALHELLNAECAVQEAVCRSFQPLACWSSIAVAQTSHRVPLFRKQ